MIKQGLGPQVFPTLVTALPLQYTYKALHRQWRTHFYMNKVMINELNDILLLIVMELDGFCWGNISVFQISGGKRFILLISI